MMSRPGRGRSARAHRVATAPATPARPDALSGIDELRWPDLGDYGADVVYELTHGRRLCVERVDDTHDCPVPDAPVEPLGVPADVDAETNAVHFAHDGTCWTVRLEDHAGSGTDVTDVVAMTRALLPR